MADPITPASKQLPETLSGRVQHIREALGMTQAKLAESANLPLSTLQDIEGGIELFLSPAVRQRLARALKIRPSTLKAVEKSIEMPLRTLSQSAREHFIEELLHFPKQRHACPFCRSPLEVRIFHRKDLEDNPLVEVKAHCINCLFKL